MASEAGHLIRCEAIHHGSVYGILLETAGAKVAMQALSVLVSSRYPDACRIGRCPHILHINARYTLELVFHRAVDGVVSMARITRHVRRHSVILKVLGGYIFGIVDIEALSIRCHHMTGNAEFRLFGALHMDVHSAHNTKRRKHAQANESQDFPLVRLCYSGPDQKDRCQCKAENDLDDENSGHEASRPPQCMDMAMMQQRSAAALLLSKVVNVGGKILNFCFF